MDTQMLVQLYVYDLSQGLASQISMQLLGTYIDAVYHTAIVLDGVEYVYDGGIKTVKPGTTHLGPPMRVLDLGTTNLPMDVILEYLESLKEIYTQEAYDVWSHNCNNFSNDFSTFLVGKGIPDHITNLPQHVLDTPLGRVLRPNIDAMVEKRREKRGGLVGIGSSAEPPQTSDQRASSVRTGTSLTEVDRLLLEAKNSCAIIFFTSNSCAPCKILYPLFDQLATEVAHKCVLIKVDVSSAFDVGKHYMIKSTPTFITFLHGVQENRWTGSEPQIIRGNVNILIEMAWPRHSHESLPLPALQGADIRPVLYSKVPPLGKLKVKMGAICEDAAIAGVLHFVSARAGEGAAEATLPDLDSLSRFLKAAPSKLPVEIMFTVVDLLRLAFVDPRFSGYYAEEKHHATVVSLLTYVNSVQNCPYSLRLVTLQMVCNMFTSPLYPTHILSCAILTTPIVELITTSLLDDKHHHVRVAAASLSFNIATSNNRFRREARLNSLPDGDQVELAASLLEAVSVEEESPEAFRGFLLAFGYLVYCAPRTGELVDLLKSMDAEGVVLSKAKLFPKEPLVKEIGGILLVKGLE